MDSLPMKAGIGSAVLLLVLSSMLVPKMQTANPQSADILAQVMGGTADAAAEQAYQEADLYFHSGAGRIAQQSANPGSSQATTLPLSGWMRNMHRTTAPKKHRHLAGAESREILPWFVVATRLNPHHIEAYSTGTYWFYTTGNAKRAEQFVCEGIRSNPKNYRLYYDRGVLYYHLKQWDKSVRDLETARDLWKNLDEESPLEYKAIGRYLNYARRHRALPGQ